MLLDYLRGLVPCPGDAPTDAELLGRFAAARDEAAFEVLVRRHGPMVWGVCLRLLADRTDTEDAFQATFLILARKAAAVARRDLLANWLHGVALRTAHKARCLRARRRAHERQVAVMPEPPVPGPDVWAGLGPLLDTELSRLADKYRLPVLLCYLQGMTRQQAATALGWPPGTVAGRLARALDLLRSRLTRRGLALSAAALATVLGEHVSAAVPDVLVAAVTGAAPGVAADGLAAASVSPAVAALAKGTLHAMNLATTLRTLAVLLIAGLVVGAGAAVWSRVPAGEQPTPAHAPLAGRPGAVQARPQDKAPPAQGGEPKRLTPEQAAELIGDYLSSEKRAIPLLNGLKLKDVTGTALWDNLHAQVFVIDYQQVDAQQGALLFNAFAIRNKKVVPLHRGLSGFQLISTCVADLRGNGKPLLVYSYSWGSGDWRAEVAALDLLQAKEPQPIVAPQKLVLDPTHAWHVKPVGDRAVRIQGGKVDFGVVEFQDKTGQPTLRLKLRDDIPEAVGKKVQELETPDKPPADKLSRTEIRKLIDDLGDPLFQVREQAMRRLLAAGKSVLPALKAALPTAQLETRRRLEKIIEELGK
jgi:RNA polymerase sigma factor (sigma-70 family)